MTRLNVLVAEVLDVAPTNVTDEDGPATLPEWTSLRHLELVVTIEEAYGISFAFEEVRAVPNVGALREVLAAKGVAA
jgi:acyl carrier protein